MSEFEVDFVSDTKCEYLLAEISYRKQRLCIINKEQGNEKMEIEFLTDLYLKPDSIAMKFPLSDFFEILKEASEELRECN